MLLPKVLSAVLCVTALVGLLGLRCAAAEPLALQPVAGFGQLREKCPALSQAGAVAYYSASNNTEAVAEFIADELNADQFEIVPAAPYTSADLNWNRRGR